MTVPAHPQTIEMIPVDAIHVLNPRARNRRQHREIVDNISTIGLKRPITVSCQKAGNALRYDLVCGEGRLEAFPACSARARSRPSSSTSPKRTVW